MDCNYCNSGKFIALKVLSLYCYVFLFGSICSLSYAQELLTQYSWDFKTDTEIAEWHGSSLSALELGDESLKATYEASDPFIISPQFLLKPQPCQYVEIRMRSTGNGSGELFFASSNEGRYGGFSQQKSIGWNIKHDGQFHTYHIRPNWLKEPQITKIRLDFGTPSEDKIKEKAYVEVDYVRILNIDVQNVHPFDKTIWESEDLKRLSFETDNNFRGWQSEVGLLKPQEIGSNLYIEWEINGDYPTPFPRAKLNCFSNSETGLISFDIPLFDVSSIDTNHSLSFARNIDLSAFKSWKGEVYRWELLLPDNCNLLTVSFSPKEKGMGIIEKKGEGSQLKLSRLPSDNIQKETTSLEYELFLRNCGGQKLSHIQVTADSLDSLQLSEVSFQKVPTDPLFGRNPIGNRTEIQSIDVPSSSNTIVKALTKEGSVSLPENTTLNPGEACRIILKYSASAVGKYKSHLVIKAQKADESKLYTQLEIFPQLSVIPSFKPFQTDYIPEPQPINSDYELGAFYFPGWSERSSWDKIDICTPNRKPLLGYYDESNSEVVDWQIKWAVENGLNFYFVDWYWYKGQIRLDHWIKAFQKAKYRSYFKWAVMWANHTGWGTHSTEDWKKVTQYWIDNYFSTPEYYTIDGKPVVVIWDQSIIDHDMIQEAKDEGIELKPGEGTKKALDLCRRLCQEAGYKGIYFIAIKWAEADVDPKTVQVYADAGFDATTIYHYMYPGDVADPMLYSFDKVVESSKTNWEEREQTGILPSLPNISTGWDSRPWHGFNGTIIYDRSVNDFRNLLQKYRSFAEVTNTKRAVFGPVNEWGEGSYIEPNNEYGFSMYEVIREELCSKPQNGFPTNYAPYEIGLGPYDLK